MADLSKDTLLFLTEYLRMCTSSCCSKCGLNDIECDPANCNTKEECKEIIKYTQKWHDTHQRKTYAQDFLEKFPNAATNKNECPRFCRGKIYGACDCQSHTSCEQCWNEFVPDDV